MSAEFNPKQVIGETERCLIIILDDDAHFDLILKEDGSKLGSCSVSYDFDDKGLDNLGYHVCPAYKKMGYMSETLPAILQYLFTLKKVDYIRAFTWPANIPSRKILERNFLFSTKDKTYLYYYLSSQEYHYLMEIKK